MPTAIQWTDETWNPATGCTKVSRGCRHCYIDTTIAFRMAGRKFVRGATDLQLHPDRLDKPLHWRKPRRVFVNSLSDLFHEDIPDEFIEAVFVTMARAHAHTFQVLTKRPERAHALLSDPGTRNFIVNRATSDNTAAARTRGWTGMVEGAQPRWPLPNVWIGVSIEDSRVTWRADVLREIPAAVRFISAEPLLGSLFDGDRPGICGSCNHSTLGHGPNGCDTEVRDYGDMDCGCKRQFAKPLDLSGIDWVIIGGESGPHARPFHLLHARELIVACDGTTEREGPAVFVKQLGAKPIARKLVAANLGVNREWIDWPLKLRDRKGGDIAEWPADLQIREFPRGIEVIA